MFNEAKLAELMLWFESRPHHCIIWPTPDNMQFYISVQGRGTYSHYICGTFDKPENTPDALLSVLAYLKEAVHVSSV